MYIGTVEYSDCTILEKLEYLSRFFPERAAALYEPKECLTYGDLWSLSGKIYAYLKKRGVGPEDTVMYCLPRGLGLYAAIVGTMRAGAAFVLTETDNSVQRTAFIRHDCQCREYVDEKAFLEILATDPMDGFVPENPHSLCYIAYTSGTSGTPKGVLHEYGSLENAGKSARCEGKPFLQTRDVFLLMSPLNFVSFPIAFAMAVTAGITVAIMPYGYGETEEKFLEYLALNHVNAGYVTPAFLRKHPSLKLPWRLCIISSEPADGLCVEGVECYNTYASTEAGCLLAVHKLSRPETPALVGFPESDAELLVLNEDGKSAGQEEGEICFRSPYIRGYLHLPGETKRLVRDGVIHTGDAGKLTPGGFVVRGRFTEMFKVQGFRVEPEEIERLVSEICGIKNPVVRGFVYKDIFSVVVFYTGEADIDVVSAREKLMKVLPEYMVPTNFVRLPHFPILETGKLDRRRLLPKEGDWSELGKIESPKLPVVGKGRTSTVLQLGENKVMKLFHASLPFATIQGEYEKTRLAHRMNIPSPEAYDVVHSRKRYGIIMDYVPGENLESLLFRCPRRRDELLKRYAEMVRKFHQIRVQNTSLPDQKEMSISIAKNLSKDKFSVQDIEKICNVFRCIPDSDGFVHGDCHAGNAIFNENGLTFIDFTLCGKGHPVFDLVCMYSHYVFLPSFEDDQSYRERTGVSKGEAENIFERFIGYYCDTHDVKFLEETKRQLQGVLAARICLSSVLFPGAFNDLVLRSVKSIAVDFSERYCRSGRINWTWELC